MEASPSIAASLPTDPPCADHARVFVVLTHEEAAALTMWQKRSPAQRVAALRAIAKIRTTIEAPTS